MLFYIAAAAVAIILTLNSIVIIPPYHFGVWNILGRRRRKEKGVLYEGPHLVWPLVSSIELISKELVPRDVKFHLTTRDRMRLSVEGVLQYRPDPTVWHGESHPDHGRNIFVSVSEDSIIKGVIETLEARIGGLGGQYGHDVFVENRQALGDIVNTVLRMSQPPHLFHRHGAGAPNPAHLDFPFAHFCGRADCPFEGDKIDAKDLVRFYNFHWPEISIIKKAERETHADHSTVELRYGIDVENFDLGNVEFTPETQKAFEEEQQAEARFKAAAKRLEVVQQFKDIGTSPDVAVDEADLLMDPKVKKKIISVQGDAGVLGGIIAGLTRRK